jgi:hypothetical protein
MAAAVYSIPKLPSKENGAKELRFFIRQRGRRTALVKPTVTGTLAAAIPAVEKRLTNVSPYTYHKQSIVRKNQMVRR